MDPNALAAWLGSHIPGFHGPVKLERLGGGQSNPTYKLLTSSLAYVLRLKPGRADQLLPSAHAIEREFRVMTALFGTAVPVPRCLALCEDESVIGRTFYVMECMDGRVMWDPAMAEQAQAARAQVYNELNRVMAALHMVRPDDVGLGDFGRSGNYLERQISRWSKQYLGSATRHIPEMESLIGWLPHHIPQRAKASSMVSVVHGDYRLDNVMFHPTRNEVVAVLDWELSTLGDPLADFANLCIAWHLEPRFKGFREAGGIPAGLPTEEEFITAYCDRTEFISVDELKADWPVYLAYNLFRLAAITQGVAKRAKEGMASSPQLQDAEENALLLAKLAWRIAREGT